MTVRTYYELSNGGSKPAPGVHTDVGNAYQLYFQVPAPGIDRDRFVFVTDVKLTMGVLSGDDVLWVPLPEQRTSGLSFDVRYVRKSWLEHERERNADNC